MINKKCDKCGYSIVSKEHIPCTIGGDRKGIKKDLVINQKIRDEIFSETGIDLAESSNVIIDTLITTPQGNR